MDRSERQLLENFERYSTMLFDMLDGYISMREQGEESDSRYLEIFQNFDTIHGNLEHHLYVCSELIYRFSRAKKGHKMAVLFAKGIMSRWERYRSLKKQTGVWVAREEYVYCNCWVYQIFDFWIPHIENYEKGYY